VNRIHAGPDVQAAEDRVAGGSGAPRWAQGLLLAAAAAVAVVLLAPAVLFVLGIGTFAVLEDRDDAGPPTTERRGERVASAPRATVGRSDAPEARAATSLATPIIAVLRRFKELDGDPKLASEGSALVGRLREMGRTPDPEAWPGLRSQVETWAAAIRASAQGTDASLVAQLGRIDGALESAP
jgi:hypothetical protein